MSDKQKKPTTDDNGVNYEEVLARFLAASARYFASKSGEQIA